jgi:hypothetical protein
MKVPVFQFQIDGRAFGAKIRRSWEEAAQDAVDKGYATWGDHNTIYLDDCQGAEIVRGVVNVD